MWFTRVSINNPVFATMVMVAIMVLGLFSYQRLSIEQMPDISIPVGRRAHALPRRLRRGRRAGRHAPHRGGGEHRQRHPHHPLRLARRASRGWWPSSSSTSTSRPPIQDVRDKVAEARRQFNRDVGEPHGLARATTTTTSRSSTSSMQLRRAQPARGLRPGRAARGQAPAGRAGRGQHRGERLGAARARHPPEARDDGRLRRGHRPDHRRDARREPGRARGRARSPTRPSAWCACRARSRTPQDFERIIVARRGTGPTPRPSRSASWPRCATRSARRRRSPPWTASAAISIQIRKTRGANTIEMAQAIRKQVADAEEDAARRRDARDQLRPLGVHPRLGGQREAHDHRGGAAHGADRVPVPALVALDRDHRPHAPDLGLRDLHRDVRVRLHHQLHHAAGAVAVASAC